MLKFLGGVRLAAGYVFLFFLGYDKGFSFFTGIFRASHLQMARSVEEEIR